MLEYCHRIKKKTLATHSPTTQDHCLSLWEISDIYMRLQLIGGMIQDQTGE